MMSYMISDMKSDRILKKMCYLFLVPILDLPIGIQMLSSCCANRTLYGFGVTVRVSHICLIQLTVRTSAHRALVPLVHVTQ